MLTKISEKHLFPGIALLLTSMFLAFNTTLFAAPIRVSEKGMAIILIAFAAFILSVSLIVKSIHRVVK